MATYLVNDTDMTSVADTKTYIDNMFSSILPATGVSF